MMRFLIGLIGLLIGLAGLPSWGMAQTQYVPENDSRVWIEGTSTVNDFTCSTQQIEGHAQLVIQEVLARPDREQSDTTHTRSTSAPAPVDTPTVQAHVPVRTLDCGKRRQNEDLYEAMKASDHPEIHYEIVKANVMASPDASRDHYVLEAVGNLTIAGETRTVRLTLQGRRLDDGRVHAQGTLPVQMTHFNVDPPTAMLGLIRVRDEITVHFDVTAVPADQP